MANQQKTQTKKSKPSKSRPLKINVGIIIFGIIFLYIVFSVYSYTTRQQIRYYEVLKGGIVRQEEYTGIALREEQAVNATSSGYIHYYIQDGRRVGVGSDVYTVDETGALEKYLEEHPELTAELSPDQVSDIRYRLTAFSRDFSNDNFGALYDMRYALDAAALEFSSLSSADDLEKALNDAGISFTRVTSDAAGVVSYAIDGDEGLKDQDVTADLLSMNGYKKNITKPGQLIEAGTPVYKLITSSSWSIVFPIDDTKKAQYQDIKTVNVHFPKQDLTAENAELSLFTAADGKDYGKITLNEFMEKFCDDRFVKFEIITNDENGLKIPLSAVTEKAFYVVPKDFMAKGEDGSTGFNRQVVSGDGSGNNTEFVPAEIYRMDDQFCYLNVPDAQDSTSLKAGDFVTKSGTDQTYQIGPTKNIQGVYNINKGYCIFRQVVPVESNNEYMIVEENTDYGIAVYDHIVLDASMVKEGQLIYQ